MDVAGEPEVCVACGATSGGCALCVSCEVRLACWLLELACALDPLRVLLDASVRPGGGDAGCARMAEPAAPVRLGVLDLLDVLDATAYELRRRLDGTDACDGRCERRPEDLWGTLVACAAHPRLARLADGGMYMGAVGRLVRRVRALLDPRELRPVGVCELCGAALSAADGDEWVECALCGRRQRVMTVRLRGLRRLCWDDSRHGSAADVARAFTAAGIRVSRKTLGTWERRGRLVRHPDGYAYCDVYRLLIGPADLT